MAARLLAEARDLSGDFDRLSQAVAEKVGLSQTDLLAMDLISRDGRVTAGRVARELHLTSGAITGLIDRLEKSGFAKREADLEDRRRVVVVPTAKGEQIGELFGPLAVALRRATDRYSVEELSVLTEFLRRMREAVGETIETIRRTSDQLSSPRNLRQPMPLVRIEELQKSGTRVVVHARRGGRADND